MASKSLRCRSQGQPVLKRDDGYEINATVVESAMLLSWLGE
jgi:hypothetical protein